MVHSTVGISIFCHMRKNTNCSFYVVAFIRKKKDVFTFMPTHLINFNLHSSSIVFDVYHFEIFIDGELF